MCSSGEGHTSRLFKAPINVFQRVDSTLKPGNRCFTRISVPALIACKRRNTPNYINTVLRPLLRRVTLI